MTNSSADGELEEVLQASADGVHRRLIEDAATHAIFMLDSGGAIATWPDPAEGLYGYASSDVLDRDVNILFADEEGMTAPVDTLLAEAREGTVETEHWHERADGSVFWKR